MQNSDSSGVTPPIKTLARLAWLIAVFFVLGMMAKPLLIVTFGAHSWRYQPDEVELALTEANAVIVDVRGYFSRDSQQEWDEQSEILRNQEGKGKGKGKGGKKGKGSKHNRRPPHFEPTGGSETDLRLREQVHPEFFDLVTWFASGLTSPLSTAPANPKPKNKSLSPKHQTPPTAY